ncbi:MAG: SHOCT domain-containing protein [Thermomicrobiales bacterium]
MQHSTRRLVGILLVILVATALLAPLLWMLLPGRQWMGPGMLWGYGAPGRMPGAGWGWGMMMGLGWLVMLAFWGAVIAGLVWLVRWVLSLEPGRPGSRVVTPSASETPLAILRRRYAAGELDQATYERMKREVQEPSGPS